MIRTNTLTYHIPQDIFQMPSSEIHFFNHEDQNLAFAYFYDAFEQHQIVVGVDVDVEVRRGLQASRSASGDRTIEGVMIVTLRFKDINKALLFKLSHEGGEA